jgi:hypothetical protein
MDKFIDTIMTALAIAFVFQLIGLRAAYHNGVTDGYGFAKEPRNPGYQRAGNYLKTFMAHRWHELKG